MGRIVEDHDQLSRILRVFRTQGKTVVFTAGAFDLLRVEHVRTLTDAASRGHYLIVGVSSDSSLQRRFGKGHPFQSARDRAEIVSVIDGVDYVTIFDENATEDLLRQLRPNLVASGQDLKLQDVRPDGLESEWLKLDRVKGQSFQQLVSKVHGASLPSNGVAVKTTIKKAKAPVATKAKSSKASKTSSASSKQAVGKKVAGKKVATKKVTGKKVAAKKGTAKKKAATGGKRARRAGA